MRSQKAFFFAYPTSIKKVLYVTDIPGTSAQGQKHLIEEQQSLWGKESPQCLCPLDHSLQSLQYPGKSTTIKHGMLESEGRGFLCSIKAGFPRAQQSNAGFHYSSGWIQSSIWNSTIFSARVDNFICLRLKSLKNCLWCTWNCGIHRNETVLEVWENLFQG